MPPFRAFIFDVNGTMIDDMRYHENAWYEILVHKLKAKLTKEEVKLQMYGKNEELFDRVFGEEKFSPDEISAIANQKEEQYRNDFLPELKLIKGLDTFLKKAQTYSIQMAIGSAAISSNVDFVLDNLYIRNYFPVIISAHDVTVSKPHPDVFIKAAEQLGIAPDLCVVFEDSPKGIEAARRAGMKAVAITSYHTAEELANDNVFLTVSDYTDERLNPLFVSS
jgi:HAD superfamily hydrolase (TIGR01509 family)